MNMSEWPSFLLKILSFGQLQATWFILGSLTKKVMCYQPLRDHQVLNFNLRVKIGQIKPLKVEKVARYLKVAGLRWCIWTPKCQFQTLIKHVNSVDSIGKLPDWVILG